MEEASPGHRSKLKRPAETQRYARSSWGIEQDTLTLKKAVEEKKCEVLILPPAVTQAVDEASADYYYEKAKTDKDLARLLESWAKFKKDYGPYGKWIDYFNMTGDHIGLVKGDA